MNDAASKVRPRVLYPFLFVAWPCLDLYARNTAEVFVREVLTVLAVLLTGAAIVFFGLRLVVREPARIGLLVASIVVVWFTYGAIHHVAGGLCAAIDLGSLKDDTGLVGHRCLMTFLSSALVLFGAWSLRSRRDLSASTRPLNYIAALLVSFALCRIGWVELVGNSAASATASATVRCLEGDGKGHGRRPDIYYIILDRYGAQEILSKAYRFENRSFLETLRKKGFYVAGSSRCNYAKSVLSLWSSLNMEYAPRGLTLRQAVDGLLDGHAVGRVLRSEGYKYIHVGSWYSPTSFCRDADINVQFSQSEFVHALMKTTPLTLLLRTALMNEDDHRDIALFQFKRLQELVSMPGPKFVFAHILLPHPPFVFARDGRRLEPQTTEKAAYIEQLEFTNSKMGELLEKILDGPGGTPLIVLQADEGPSLRGEDRHEPLAQRRRIRTGILNAYLLPASATSDLYSTITPVNTFRLIFANVLGKKIDLLEDRIYDVSIEAAHAGVETFRFEDVTDQVNDA